MNHRRIKIEFSIPSLSRKINPLAQIAKSCICKALNNVEEHHHTIGELPAVLAGYRQNLAVELLDDQADDKILCVIFLRHDEENGAFLRTEFFRVDCRIKAQYSIEGN